MMTTARLDAGQTEQLVLELLKTAAAAHGVHEKEDCGGVYDEQWPAWYAAHITRALAARGYAIAPMPVPPPQPRKGQQKRPSLAESFDLSGDVAGWDDWL
jgi:hypothetical protein